MNTKLILIVIILLLLLFVFISPLSLWSYPSNPELQKGEAFIWYLNHSGWALKTKNFLLIFDYWEREQKPDKPALTNGYINPAEIKDQTVYVFVSHGHGDHYDETILEWENTVKDITYVFGWKALDNPDYVYLDKPRAHYKSGGLEVMTINHEFDGIPEVAFLVKADGLSLFHSGDHGSTGEILNPIFRDNIDYLVEKVQSLDVAFISIFGSTYGDDVNKGDLYTIEKLSPKVIFPMHQGGREHTLKRFANEAEQKDLKTEVVCVEHKGDSFIYGKGIIKKLNMGGVE